MKRPRIKKNLVACSNTDSKSAEIAAYNRKEFRKTCLITKPKRKYILLFGEIKVYIGEKNITLQDALNAQMSVYID